VRPLLTCAVPLVGALGGTVAVGEAGGALVLNEPVRGRGAGERFCRKEGLRWPRLVRRGFSFGCGWIRVSVCCCSFRRGDLVRPLLSSPLLSSLPGGLGVGTGRARGVGGGGKGYLQWAAGWDCRPSPRHLCWCAWRAARAERRAQDASSRCRGACAGCGFGPRRWRLRLHACGAGVGCI
jgi:hypothetical protein